MSPEIPGWVQEAIETALAEHKDAIAELVIMLESLLGAIDTKGFMTVDQQASVRMARYMIDRFKHVRPPT